MLNGNWQGRGEVGANNATPDAGETKTDGLVPTLKTVNARGLVAKSGCSSQFFGRVALGEVGGALAWCHKESTRRIQKPRRKVWMGGINMGATF